MTYEEAILLVQNQDLETQLAIAQGVDPAFRNSLYQYIFSVTESTDENLLKNVVFTNDVFMRSDYISNPVKTKLLLKKINTPFSSFGKPIKPSFEETKNLF